MKYLTGDNCTVRVEFYAKMVISNYTGRYTTIHRRNRPSDKRNPPFRSTSRYSAKTLFVCSQQPHTLLLSGISMETQTQSRFDAPPEAPADHLTKPEGCLPTTTGPPKHRTAHLKEKKLQAKCWAVQHRCTDIGKGNTKGYLLRLLLYGSPSSVWDRAGGFGRSEARSGYR